MAASPDPLELLLRHGADYHAEGNNAVVLAVDRRLLHGAGLNPESLCPAFAGAERLALKIMRRGLPGLAAGERALQDKALGILDAMDQDGPVRIPRIVDSRTSGTLAEPALLTRLTGIVPCGGRVEYLLMDWADGVDFVTLAYRAALRGHLHRAASEFGGTAAMYEAELILDAFLDAKIMQSASRMAAGEDDSVRAQRIGGQLRRALREGSGALSCWNKLLPEAREVALRELRVGEIMEALAQARSSDMQPALRIIDAQFDVNALETAIVRVNQDRLPEYITEYSERGRRDAFFSMLRDQVRGQPLVPVPLRLALQHAVRHFNRLGAFHNDLHERNIMIANGREHIFIIDWATATFNGQSTGGDDGIFSPEGLLAASSA